MQKKRFDNKDRLSTFLLSCLIAAMGLNLFPHPTAWAHGVYIYAWVEGDTIYTESYFGAKGKVKGGLVQVLDPSGKKLLEGRTDDQGEFSFKSPQKTELRIVVEAGMGHKAEFYLGADEQSNVSNGEPETFETGKTTEASRPPIQAEVDQIKAIVEQALDARLKPIRRELAAIRKQRTPGFTEIIGGIGYILGLMGLVMYFKSRKRE